MKSSVKLPKPIREALKKVLTPSVQSGDITDLIHEAKDLPTIHRSVLGPGSGSLVLSEVPELADYYSAEILDGILEDIWWRPEIQTFDVDLLCFANPLLDLENLEQSLDQVSDASEVARYQTRGALAVRLFLRHNPNASDVTTSDMQDVGNTVLSCVNMDIVSRLIPQLFIETRREPYEYAIDGNRRDALEQWVKDYILSSRFDYNSADISDWFTLHIRDASISQEKIAELVYLIKYQNIDPEGKAPLFDHLIELLRMVDSLEKSLNIHPQTYAMDRII